MEPRMPKLLVGSRLCSLLRAGQTPRPPQARVQLSSSLGLGHPSPLQSGQRALGTSVSAQGEGQDLAPTMAVGAEHRTRPQASKFGTGALPRNQFPLGLLDEPLQELTMALWQHTWATVDKKPPHVCSLTRPHIHSHDGAKALLSPSVIPPLVEPLVTTWTGDAHTVCPSIPLRAKDPRQAGGRRKAESNAHLRERGSLGTRARKARAPAPPARFYRWVWGTEPSPGLWPLCRLRKMESPGAGGPVPPTGVVTALEVGLRLLPAALSLGSQSGAALGAHLPQPGHCCWEVTTVVNVGRWLSWPWQDTGTSATPQHLVQGPKHHR